METSQQGQTPQQSSSTPVSPQPPTQTTPPSSSLSSQSRRSPPVIIILGVIAVILFLITGYLLFATDTFNRKSKIVTNPTALPTVPVKDVSYSFLNPYQVTIKENPGASNSSQLYVKNTQTDTEELWATVPDVYTEHYNPAQFVDNKLYVIRRTGGNEGYLNNPNWTDELWRYTKDSTGQKLYSQQGLSFLVSQNGEFIAVTNNESVTILSSQGKALKKIASNQITSNPENTSSVNLLTISPFNVFVGDMAGPVLVGLSTIAYPSLELQKYDISKLKVGTEYSVNPVKNLLAYSDYPPMFDVDSATNFKNSGTPVTLSIYGLGDSLNSILATSSALQFSPLWINETTLEYNSPTGSGVLKKTF